MELARLSNVQCVWWQYVSHVLGSGAFVRRLQWEKSKLRFAAWACKQVATPVLDMYAPSSACMLCRNTRISLLATHLIFHRTLNVHHIDPLARADHLINDCISALRGALNVCVTYSLANVSFIHTFTSCRASTRRSASEPIIVGHRVASARPLRRLWRPLRSSAEGLKVSDSARASLGSGCCGCSSCPVQWLDMNCILMPVLVRWSSGKGQLLGQISSWCKWYVAVTVTGDARVSLVTGSFFRHVQQERASLILGRSLGSSCSTASPRPVRRCL